MPATIVGSANGRSITALSGARTIRGSPSSRTRNHAIAVPITALITATSSEQISVRISALTAWRLETACQNPLQPWSVDFATTAASGISTMRLSHIVPRPRLRAPSGALSLVRRARVASLLRSGDPRVLLDLGDRALVRVEELRVDLVPAAELVDRLQVRRSREL